MEELLGMSGEASSHLEVVPLLRNLILALVLGSIVASRPWRKPFGMPPMVREMFHAHILIAVAGAVAVSVIGDSLARAFGLVGLGGFIRFRTGIRDPRDAAVFFLLIGLGMACGLGSVMGAIVCAGFVTFVLFLLDYSSKSKPTSYVRISARTEDPRGAADLARAAIEEFPVRVRASTVRIEAHEIRFDLENSGGVPPADIVAAMVEKTGGMLTAVHYENLDTLKGSIRL